MCNLRKILLIFVFLFSLSLYSYSNTGIGAAFSFQPSLSHPVFSFSARSDLYPWSSFLNVSLEDNSVSSYADNWFINERMSDCLDYYVLWGVSGRLCVDEKKTECTTGARLGAGLDFFFFDRKLELFSQFSWNPDFGVKKEDGKSSFVYHILSFPCTLGIRSWF